MNQSPYEPPQSSAPFPENGGFKNEHASSAVKGPAIGLLVAGILSLLGALYVVFQGVVTVFVVPQMVEQAEQTDPNLQQQMEQLQQTGMDPETFFQVYGGAILIWAILLLISSLLMIVGAISMMRLKSRGLAMTASILAIVPCTSGCCLFSLPLGIWVLMVLSKDQVKAGFP